MKSKKNMKRTASLILAFALLLGITTSGESVVSRAATKPHLNTKKLSLKVGQTDKLTLVNIKKADRSKIKWSSSKKSVVAVKATANKSKVKITAKKKGTSVITAGFKGKKYSCRVSVSKPTVYVEVTPTPTPRTGNLTFQFDVTAEMTKASYWVNIASEPDKVLISLDEIDAVNQKNYASSETYMYDLKAIDETFDPIAKRENLAEALMDEVREERIGSRTTIYKNGYVMDTAAIDSWFAEMKSNILNSSDRSGKVKYAICTERADMWMAPNSDPIGWSNADADDEFVNSSMNVNEPLVVEAVTADGKFFYGKNNNCSGWVQADHFAICDDRQTWLNQWDLTDDEVLVVTTSHITLEKSNLTPQISGVDLMLGTQLPLVPKDQIPENIAERGTWYNYVVYLPTRGENGELIRSVALISSHHYVNVGYVPLTKRNILYLAFSCLGDRYGWGGMLHAMDCSMYTRSIYRCFGLEIPRNTTWQKAMPTYRVDLSEMSDSEKRKAISKLPTGAMLMFSGHIMMYIGEVGGKQYVISDLGSLSETKEAIGEDAVIQSMYCVSINSLDVRRRSGNTWLADMQMAIVPWK